MKTNVCQLVVTMKSLPIRLETQRNIQNSQNYSNETLS